MADEIFHSKDPLAVHVVGGDARPARVHAPRNGYGCTA
jgi:hypothetical protein